MRSDRRSVLRVIALRLFPRLRGHEKGQSLVEFAMLLPVLMLLLLGSVDFGRAMYAVVTVNNAAFHSSLWTANHLKQGTNGCGSGSTSTTICCPPHNNTAAFDANATPGTVREIVLRDFLVGLGYSSSCSTATGTFKTASISDDCNPAVTCTTDAEAGYTYGGGTPYRYVDVTVTYRWKAIGPYDALVGTIDVPKTVRIRKIP